MGLGPQIQTNGNVQSTWVLTVSLTPGATAATTVAEQSFTVAGLQVGDQISDISLTTAFPNNLCDIVNARVSAANTLTLAFSNGTAGSLTYPSGTYYVEVNRIYPGLTMSVIQ